MSLSFGGGWSSFASGRGNKRRRGLPGAKLSHHTRWHALPHPERGYLYPISGRKGAAKAALDFGQSSQDRVCTSTFRAPFKSLGRLGPLLGPGSGPDVPTHTEAFPNLRHNAVPSINKQSTAIQTHLCVSCRSRSSLVLFSFRARRVPPAVLAPPVSFLPAAPSTMSPWVRKRGERTCPHVLCFPPGLVPLVTLPLPHSSSRVGSSMLQQ